MKKLLALFLLTALLVLPACGSSKQPMPATIAEIFSAYKENGVRADEMYQNKPLLILGIVKKINSSNVEVIDVEGDTSHYLTANFNTNSKDMKKLSELNVGDMIAVTGQLDNNNVIFHAISYSYIRLWDCALVPFESPNENTE
jgi:hypothetical protein